MGGMAKGWRGERMQEVWFGDMRGIYLDDYHSVVLLVHAADSAADQNLRNICGDCLTLGGLELYSGHAAGLYHSS